MALFVLWVPLFWYLRNPVIFASGEKLGGVIADSVKLEAHVRRLSAITPPRQYKNEKSMREAESYVEAELQKLGYQVERQEVFAFEKSYSNLIARFGDKTAKEVVVVGAHYDVCDDQPGADDNASGVAGVLEIARLLRQHNPRLGVPVELVIYSLEEPPFFATAEMGSAVHAEELKKAGVSVKYMISLEMIGYFSDSLFSQFYEPALLYGFYPWTGNFIGVVGVPGDREWVRDFKIQMSANADLPVYSINAPRFLPGVDFSDHRSYWNHDWPALMVTDTAFLRNDQYHLKGDTPDRLDYKRMAEVVRGVYSAIVLTNTPGSSH